VWLKWQSISNLGPIPSTTEREITIAASMRRKGKSYIVGENVN
jgi:hypothetical protein